MAIFYCLLISIMNITCHATLRLYAVSQELLHSKGIDLVCNGLDTVASIQINEFIVGNANNMHRKYIYNIKEFLKVSTWYLDY